MVTYPIRMARDTYKGGNRQKQLKSAYENQDIARLEAFINDMLLKQTEPIASYLFHDIARESGFDYEFVAKHGFSIDCGHNGFTAWRYDLTYEQAMKATGLHK